MFDYQLWTTGVISKQPIPACGSSTVGYVDKRLNVANRIKYIKERATALNNDLYSGRKVYIGFSWYGSDKFIPFE